MSKQGLNEKIEWLEKELQQAVLEAETLKSKLTSRGWYQPFFWGLTGGFLITFFGCWAVFGQSEEMPMPMDPPPPPMEMPMEMPMDMPMEMPMDSMEMPMDSMMMDMPMEESKM